MRIDPMMICIVEKFQAALGDVASQARTESLLAPVPEWRGRDVLDFVNRLRVATDDEFMGIGASPCALGASDFLIQLTARCETLREALNLAAQFMAITTKAAEFRLIEAADNAVIEIIAKPSPRDPEQALVDWNMVIWHKLSQWLIAGAIWLDRTEFAHPLDANYSSYADMFGGECVFNCESSRMFFARSYLDLRVVRTAAEGDRLRTDMQGHFAKPVGFTSSWKQHVKNILRVEFATGKRPSTIEDLAAEIGVSSQTLRRRLIAEGSSYRSLKAQARQEFALDVMADEGATVGDASLAAGFADPNALTRALKTTQGISATQLRDQVRQWRESGGRDEDDPPPALAQ